MSELSPEDQKLVTLARSSRVRNGAEAGAAVRDADGRTYAGTSVNLAAFAASAFQAAVAAAVSSGAPGFEAGAVVSERAVQPADYELANELGIVIIHAGPDGNVYPDGAVPA